MIAVKELILHLPSYGNRLFRHPWGDWQQSTISISVWIVTCFLLRTTCVAVYPTVTWYCRGQRGGGWGGRTDNTKMTASKRHSSGLILISEQPKISMYLNR